MQGRGAKGSIKDRLLQNRLIRYYKKKKKKQKLLREKKRKQQLLEDQKRIAFVYQDIEKSLPKLPKRWVVDSSFQKKKKSVVLPQKMPLLVEAIYEKNVGIGTTKKTSPLEKQLENKTVILEQKAKALVREAKKEQTKNINQKYLLEKIQKQEQILLEIRERSKNLDRDYHDLRKQYYSFKKENWKFSKGEVKEKLCLIEKICDEVEELIKKEKEILLSKKEEKKEENEISKTSPSSAPKEKKSRVENPILTPKKEKNIDNISLTIYPGIETALSFHLYRNRLSKIEEKNQVLTKKIKNQKESLQSIWNQVGMVRLEWKQKEKKIKGIHDFFKKMFKKAILYLFTPFQPKQKKVVYKQMKEINSDIRYLRKMIHPKKEILLSYQDDSKALDSIQESTQGLSCLVQDSLKEIGLLKAELKEEFQLLNEHTEYQEIMNSILFLERSLQRKQQEIEHTNTILKEAYTKNNQKIKKLQNYHK